MSTLMNTSDCNKENAKCIDASDIKGKNLVQMIQLSILISQNQEQDISYFQQ